jgi:cytidine deaminase
MRTIEITTTLKIYECINQLPDDVRDLMNQAIDIRKKAYAPYSNFQVGAAIQLENSKIVLGSNQENAAYPSGLCAERVAIFQAGALYPNVEIKKIAISATSIQKPVLSPIPPCGACRQSIAEYEFKQDRPIEIYFMGESGKVYVSHSLQNLLPLSFDKKFL